MPTNLLHHGSQNRIQKTSRNMAARKGPRLYKKQSGTQREKNHVLTLTLMLVRRKSACKTSAGSSKILRWLTPLLGPNLDPKTGPKQRPKRRNENVGSRFGPKSGVSHRRILLLPAEVLQADLRRTSMSVSVNTWFFSLCVPLCFLYSSSCFTVCFSFFSPLSLRRGVVVVCFEVTMDEFLPIGLRHVISGILAGGIPGFRTVLLLLHSPSGMAW